MVSCKSTWSSYPAELKAEDMKVYVLNNVEVFDETGEVEIIANREVAQEIPLSKQEKEAFLKALFNESNYEQIDRKCTMEPVYAVKNQKKLIALFDVEYCPYTDFIHKDGTKTKRQLIADNSIVEILLKKE